jgi:hypothetical protein
MIYEVFFTFNVFFVKCRILTTNQAGEVTIWDYQVQVGCCTISSGHLYNGSKFCFQLVTVNMLIYVQAIAKSFDLSERPGILSGITISIYSFFFLEKREKKQAGFCPSHV